MPNVLKILIIIALSYLFGSIPWALVIGKIFFHKDVRQYGSGNLGGTNAGRVLGKPAGAAVTLLDAFKGVLSMWVAYIIFRPAVPFAGLACCIGHCFPIFAHFKGGKAVATTFGYFIGLAAFVNHNWFWQFLFPTIMFFLILYLCRMVSVASMTSVGLEVLASALLVRNPIHVTLCLLVLWLFIVYRHRENIRRIKAGTESKIQWMGKTK